MVFNNCERNTCLIVILLTLVQQLCCRTPVTEDFAQGYPSDEEWHGYINNNDRVLLKVSFFPSSLELVIH